MPGLWLFGELPQVPEVSDPILYKMREAFVRTQEPGRGSLTESRLKEIVGIAGRLHWIIPSGGTHNTPYPLMQLSEVEKCMLAMVDDHEFERMKQWDAEGKA